MAETPRTVGVEEELLLVDLETRLAAPRSSEVTKRFREHGRGREASRGRAGAATDELDQELFLHQLETRTDPSSDLGNILDQLRAARRTAGVAAEDAGLAIAATGTAPTSSGPPRVTRNQRYEEMVATFGDVARTAGTCGMHVHVAVDSDEEGVAVIDRITPWLPVLLAFSANSPFSEGRDTGHSSWRAQQWARWPSAGPTEAFGSVESYREVCRQMIASGAARDEGMLYFDARLSAEHPTIEVRVCDVCTDPADAVVVAALARGLVETAARDWAAGREAPVWRAELLRAAQWRASRFGLSSSLVHPLTREPAPATDVLDDLVELLRPVLEESGDLQLVSTGVQRPGGGGASRQRAALERTGTVEGVVDDLVARTRATWKQGID